jgi:hypothetical protein
MPHEGDQSGGQQRHRHELQRIVDMTDEQQLYPDANDAHHDNDQQNAPQGGELLTFRRVAHTRTSHAKSITDGSGYHPFVDRAIRGVSMRLRFTRGSLEEGDGRSRAAWH